MKSNVPFTDDNFRCNHHYVLEIAAKNLAYGSWNTMFKTRHVFWMNSNDQLQISVEYLIVDVINIIQIFLQSRK